MNDSHRQDRAWQDPIVAEVRAVRSALFAASGNDIREFCRRLREEQAVSGHDILTRVSHSRLEPAGTSSSLPLPRPIG
jgi:predicted outer membrane protein